MDVETICHGIFRGPCSSASAEESRLPRCSNLEPDSLGMIDFSLCNLPEVSVFFLYPGETSLALGAHCPRLGLQHTGPLALQRGEQRNE